MPCFFPLYFTLRSASLVLARETYSIKRLRYFTGTYGGWMMCTLQVERWRFGFCPWFNIYNFLICTIYTKLKCKLIGLLKTHKMSSKECLIFFSISCAEIFRITLWLHVPLNVQIITWRYCEGSNGTKSDRNLSKNTRDFLLVAWKPLAMPKDSYNNNNNNSSMKKNFLETEMYCMLPLDHHILWSKKTTYYSVHFEVQKLPEN